MKASRYVKPFEVEVDRWERTLSLIMEVVEMILTVQRQWMYLEVCVFLYKLNNHSQRSINNSKTRRKERWRSGIVSVLLCLRLRVRPPLLS